MNESDQPVSVLRSEFVMRLGVEFDDAVQLGEVPLGSRRVLYVRTGWFEGPGMRGNVLPGGGDWVLGRRDGVSQLDIRMLLCADSGKLIALAGAGVLDIEPNLRARIAQGEDVDPGHYYFRTGITFETSAVDLLWLNRVIAVGIGRRTTKGMRTDVFVVR